MIIETTSIDLPRMTHRSGLILPPSIDICKPGPSSWGLAGCRRRHGPIFNHLAERRGAEASLDSMR
jgi:hypothetical protein